MTTANITETNDGSIDAVAASLVAQPEEQPEDDTTDPKQADAEGQADDAQDDVDDQPEAEGDEEVADEDETAEEDEGQKAQKFKVKVDGQELDVTLDDLKRAYAGQGYIQKRMEEVANVRKASEAEFMQLNQERAQLAQALTAVQQRLAADAPRPPSRELLQSDPIRYLEEEVAYRDAVERQQQIGQQVEMLTAQQRQAQAIEHQRLLSHQAEVLKQRIPEFADAKKAGELKKAIFDAGQQHYGLDPNEIGSVADARYIHILHDAVRYRQMMANKDKVQEKVAQARPMVRPGAKTSPSEGGKIVENKARARMRQTGSVDDVASFLLSKR